MFRIIFGIFGNQILTFGNLSEFSEFVFEASEIYQRHRNSDIKQRNLIRDFGTWILCCGYLLNWNFEPQNLIETFGSQILSFGNLSGFLECFSTFRIWVWNFIRVFGTKSQKSDLKDSLWLLKIISIQIKTKTLINGDKEMQFLQILNQICSLLNVGTYFISQTWWIWMVAYACCYLFELNHPFLYM